MVCEEVGGKWGMMMSNVGVGLMEGLDISWKGKLTGGGYNIMKEQASQ
jgi:hypothetical protein